MLVTGSCGLVGSESVVHFCKDPQNTVYGIDNDMRCHFFGKDASTSTMLHELSCLKNYVHHAIDIRDRDAIFSLLRSIRPDVIIHAAAQPSHDWPVKNDGILDDFEVNSLATLYLLEASRLHCGPDVVFIFMSTNKVYGDNPNRIALKELETRFDFDDPAYAAGVDETMSVQDCFHSFFGVSKLSADTLVKEYGKCFGMNTVSFRGGCLTGSRHAGTHQHGFLSYLIKCGVSRTPYRVNGNKGKVVRDNIHSSDLVQAFDAFIQSPRHGEVYNIGGCRQNSISIIEAMNRVQEMTGLEFQHELSDDVRRGDHVCYYTDMSKFREHYPMWKIQYGLDDIFGDIIESCR